MGEVRSGLAVEDPALSSPPQILAIGMLPPPLGGQAVMFEAAVAELRNVASVDVVDIQAQSNIGESGKLGFGKVAWFANLIIRELLPRRRRSYDILYFNPAGPNRLALIKDIVILSLIRPRVKKRIYHFHATGIGALIAKQPAVIRHLAERTLFHPDLAIRCADVSPNDAEYYRARASKIIANGIPDPMAAYRGRTRREAGRLQLVFIGAMVDKKGIFDLIEVADQLQSEGADFVMHFVGEGLPADLARFDELVKRRGLGSRIVRHGVLTGSAKFDLLFESDVLLFPSYWASETQPLVLIEAHAMGLPAVAYDLGGIKTIVRDGVSGYLVKLRDTRAFAGAIQRCADRRHGRELGAAGRRHFEKNFTLEKFASGIRAAALEV